MSLTEAELAAIAARCDAATPGPWEVWNARMDLNRIDVSAYINCVGSRELWMQDGYMRAVDARFVAHAREDVPKLLAALREARDLAFWVGMERDALRAEVARLKELRAHGCECGDDDACKFARERDEARAEVERLRESLDNTYSNADECNDAIRQLAEAKALLRDVVTTTETRRQIAGWLEANG